LSRNTLQTAVARFVILSRNTLQIRFLGIDLFGFCGGRLL